MNGSMKLTLASGLLMLNVLSGCESSQPSTATDRLKPQAVMCASALADGVIESARRECLAHLAQLEALADW